MIAIVSDTHLPRGARELPAGCSALLAAARAIVHAGDFTELSVLAHLEALAPVHAVHGNCDVHEIVRALPARATVEIDGRRIGVVHDAGPREGRHARLLAWFPGCDVIVYGHSHQPELSRVGGAWVLNPGSPTERRRAPSHTMIVLRDGEPQLVDLDAP